MLMAQASRDLDVHVNVMRKWVREVEADPKHAFPGQGQTKPEQAELDRLKPEVANLKMEGDILKLCRGQFRQGVDVKYGFVAKHRWVWPVGMMCEMLGVSRSGFYA